MGHIVRATIGIGYDLGQQVVSRDNGKSHSLIMRKNIIGTRFACCRGSVQTLSSLDGGRGECGAKAGCLTLRNSFCLIEGTLFGRSADTNQQKEGCEREDGETVSH